VRPTGLFVGAINAAVLCSDEDEEGEELETSRPMSMATGRVLGVGLAQDLLEPSEIAVACGCEMVELE
jgi:hypothetical protein